MATGNVTEAGAAGTAPKNLPKGPALLRDPMLNKGTAFTEAERAALGLDGLLPPQVFTMEEQVRARPGELPRASRPISRSTST